MPYARLPKVEGRRFDVSFESFSLEGSLPNILLATCGSINRHFYLLNTDNWSASETIKLARTFRVKNYIDLFVITELANVDLEAIVWIQ